MSYIQLNIVANEYQQEELVALLDDYEPTGFEQRESELVVYFNEEGYNEAEINQIISAYEHQKHIVEEKNWNEEWEKNFQPVVVDDFCAVRADFHQPIKGIAYEIIITPKMSFGTGHHATTYMMIQQMQNIDFVDKKVFDFGTGTGILAILAEKLGAKSITAIDVDDWSIENAKENCERNQCSKISLTLSSLIPQEKFDVVLANINLNVIVQYAQQLKEILAPKGRLLISGLLALDKEEMIKIFTVEEFDLVQFSQKDNWISILYEHRDKS